MKKSYLILPLLALAACSNPEPNPTPNPTDTEVPGEGYTPEFNPNSVPQFVFDIPAYDGRTASDAPTYPADAGLNPDMNQWAYIINVNFDGQTATIDKPEGCSALVSANGANVNIDLGTGDLVKIIASGTSNCGSIRIAGDRRHLLQLNDLHLTSPDRPAINDQNSKRVFLELVGSNSIADGPNYLPVAEDRKGCFFAEGHVILCGSGTLTVQGNHAHGFATDGFLYVTPGPALAVTDAVRNAIHVKGSASENNLYRGIEITGGLVYAHTSAPRGKALKSDSNIRIRGGECCLYASGPAAIDPEDGTLSSPACIKSDVSVAISGGCSNLIATGSGAKGIKANSAIEIKGGLLSVALSGNSTADSGDSATPKGIKADTNLIISGGGINVCAKGTNAVGIEAETDILMTSGVVYTFGTACGIEASFFSHTQGTVLAGGQDNTICAGAQVQALTDIRADQVSRIMSADGSTSLAAFRWPIALSAATLLFAQ